MTSDSEVSAKKTAYEGKKEDAIAQLTATVDALKSEVDTALAKEDPQEKYDALTTVQEKISDLGTYATELYNNYRASEIGEALKNLVQEVAETMSFETYIAHSTKTDYNVYVIIRKYINVLGNPIQFEDRPNVTVSEKVTAGDNSTSKTLTAEVEYHEENGTYIATISFTRITGDNDTVELTYQWGAEEQQTVKLGKFKQNLYNTDSVNRLYKSTGERVDFGNSLSGKDRLYDFYAADDLNITNEKGIDEYNDDELVISGLPILHGVSESLIGNSLADLTMYLAKEGLRGEMDLRLVVYHKWIDETTGAIHYTAMHKNSVSEKLHFDLTDDDQYTRLKTHLDGEVWHLHRNYDSENSPTDYNRIDYAWQVVTSEEEKELREGAYIYVYNANDYKEQIQDHDFTIDTPFAVYEIIDGSWVLWTEANGNNSAIDDVIREAWIAAVKESGEKDVNKIETQYTFVFGLQVKANEAAKEQNYIDSEVVYATKDGERECKEYTFQKSDIQATSEAQVVFTDNGYFGFLRKEQHYGWVFIEKNVDHVEFKLTKGEVSYTLYLYAEDTDGNNKYEGSDKLYLYTSPEKDESTRRDCNKLNDSNVPLSDFNEWMQQNITHESFNATEWALSTRVIVNENSGWLFDGDWSAEVKYQA